MLSHFKQATQEFGLPSRVRDLWKSLEIFGLPSRGDRGTENVEIVRYIWNLKEV